jgi:hypothetical protein
MCTPCKQPVDNLFHNYHQTSISRTIALLQLRLFVIDWCYKKDYLQADKHYWLYFFYPFLGKEITACNTSLITAAVHNFFLTGRIFQYSRLREYSDE